MSERLPERYRGPSVKVLEASADYARVSADLDDISIVCRVSTGGRENWRKDTGLKILDKMLYIIENYSGTNIELLVSYKTGRPTTRVVEVSGLVLGEAFGAVFKKRAESRGVRGFGFSRGIFKEAVSEVGLSIEAGPGLWISRGSGVKIFGKVGEVPEETMKSFFGGLADGLRASIHVDLLKSESPFNLWISAFMALGDALRQALTEDSWFRQRKEPA